jgi:hypothetical protein
MGGLHYDMQVKVLCRQLSRLSLLLQGLTDFAHFLIEGFPQSCDIPKRHHGKSFAKS